VRFSYQDKDGKEKLVHTLEEDEYPNQYHRRLPIEGQVQDSRPQASAVFSQAATPSVIDPQPTITLGAELKEQHLVFQENQRGVSFEKLFGPYFAGAKRIVITDPYMRMFHQVRNLMELMETISKCKVPDEEVAVHAVTVQDETNADRQIENLQKIASACLSVGIQFTWAFDTSGTKHDCDITTDHGWKIVLSRGLDVFQRFELNDAFDFANRMQEHRQCKEFNVTYVRLEHEGVKP
jgi:ATP-dependent Lon protease